MNTRETDAESAEAVGHRLLLLRTALGYGGRRQKAFADLLDMTSTRYHNYEAGTQRPPVEAALQIIRKTGANLDWIYRGIEDLLPVHLAAKIRAAANDLNEPERESA